MLLAEPQSLNDLAVALRVCLFQIGQVPRRQPQNKQSETELVQLRKRLSQAINEERYEEAARLRDKIKQVEAS